MILDNQRSYFLLPVAYDNAREPLIPSQLRAAPIGLGAANCDPFWTQQNGGCSDEFGQYLTASGDVVPLEEVVATVKGTDWKDSVSGWVGKAEGWFDARSPLALAALGVVAFALLSRRRR